MKKKPRRKRSPVPHRSPEWQELRRGFRNHPAFEFEEVYALPRSLIESIRIESPNLISNQDLGFERALRSLGGDGFFLARPFTYPSLAKYREPTSDTLTVTAYDREIREWYGDNAVQVDRFLTAQARFDDRLQELRSGYAGWLATDWEFRQNCALVFANFGEAVRNWGWFPPVPHILFGVRVTPLPDVHKDIFGRLSVWYREWSLERLATWQLPVPLASGLHRPSLYVPDHVIGGGMMLFVPWYLLRDRGLTLKEIASHQVSSTPLTRWTENTGTNWGYQRYSEMLALHVFWELALQQRYADRLAGQTGRLERAFARMFLAGNGPAADVPDTPIENKVDAVHKVRQEMRRRLAQTGRPKTD